MRVSPSTLIAIAAAVASSIVIPASAFLPDSRSGAFVARADVRPTQTAVSSSPQNEETDGTVVQEYRNTVTEVLSNFMQQGGTENEETEDDPLAEIDFDAPKFGKVDLATLAEILDYELCEKEWFVTGNVNPVYFSDEFKFQDPDVKVDGIEDYAKGVYKLFDQETSHAEIISTLVNEEVPNTITCTWRLSGKVKIGPGLSIKPYICYTDLTVDEETGLITFQEDRFDIPGWDILLSSVFPFLIGTVLSSPAPPVEPREVAMPAALSKAAGKSAEGSPMDKLFSFFGN